MRIPPLQMDLLNEPQDLFQITEESARNFLEESLLVMISTTRKCKQTEECDTPCSPKRSRLTAAISALSISFIDDENCSPRSDVSDVTKLPPKSPRFCHKVEISPRLRPVAMAAKMMARGGFNSNWRIEDANETKKAVAKESVQSFDSPRAASLHEGKAQSEASVHSPLGQHVDNMPGKLDFDSPSSVESSSPVSTARGVSTVSTSLSPRAAPQYQKPKSSITGKLANMPRFYFPTGRPISQEENDATKENVRKLFESHPNGQIPFAAVADLCRCIRFAAYAKEAVYKACLRLSGLSSDDYKMPLSFSNFTNYWQLMTKVKDAHDEASRFIFTLAVARTGESDRNYLTKEDFLPMLMDLIHTHPGLSFLASAQQFHAKYCEVVTVRIFWNVNRSWTGRITAQELRRSNFLEIFHTLDAISDINKVTEYFSYEHFYVTYCKFWELDTDHDMVISRDDMRGHCQGALTDRIIDRIFSAAVTRIAPEPQSTRSRGPVQHPPIETIGFEEFVAFLLAEEDKKHPTSIEYWFRCLDVDGDGLISLYEMEYFYRDIERKLEARNMETLGFNDVICNLLDLVAPKNGPSVTLNDLKKCGLAHRFFNTFVNYIKYVEQESSEGERASLKTNGDKEMSDWDQFCAVEYEMLMGENDDGDGYADENIDVNLDDDESDDMGRYNQAV
jgi:serine/threonine-protein phosphatase 2A regulatory subunit B''